MFYDLLANLSYMINVLEIKHKLILSYKFNFSMSAWECTNRISVRFVSKGDIQGCA